MTKHGIDSQNVLFPEVKVRLSTALRRRVPLILPRILRDEAARLEATVGEEHAGYKVMLRWADLESGGHLDRKETSLDADDLALMNPNTHTCPIFRSRRDADLTRHIYRRIPIRSAKDERNC